MAPHDPDITLYFLGASRAIRIAWLLEELSLPYRLVSSPRASNGLAPPEFKAKIPTKLGKSPVIQDGNIVIQESSAIAEYVRTKNLVSTSRWSAAKLRVNISGTFARSTTLPPGCCPRSLLRGLKSGNGRQLQRGLSCSMVLR